MKTTRAAAALLTIAGTAVPIATVSIAAVSTASAQGTAFRGNSVSCSVSAWVWEGGINDDFMLSANWFDCGVLDGPTDTLPVYFGPVDQFINGVYQTTLFPFQPATLTQDFASPAVRLLSNSDTGLTVIGATYTAPGTIGERSDSFDHDGIATLTLDNATWNGSLTLATNQGNARLILLNSPTIVGTLALGSGTAIIENFADFQLASNFNNSSQGEALWINKVGATTTLNINLGFARSWPAQPAEFSNQDGTLRKTGAGTSTISWDFTGTGTIEVDEGILSLNNLIDGNFAAVVADGAQLRLSGTTTADTAFQVTGDLNLQPNLDSIALELSGNYNIVSTNSLGLDIVNNGNARFTNSPNNASSQATSWRNASGASAEFVANAGLNRSWPDQPAMLINEADAIVLKTEGTTSTMGWETLNEGTIICESGTLRFSGGLHSDGHIEIIGGTVDVDGAISGVSTVTVSEGGLFAIGGEPAPEAEYDITGDVRLDALQGGGTLRLAGEFDIVTASSQTGVGIINTGNARLLSSPNNASAYESSWHNTPGASLEFVGTADLNRSWPSQPASLTNDDGATIIKSGGSSSTVGWATVNQGTIVCEDGTLRFSDEFFSSGHIEITGGTVDLNAEFSGSSTVTVHESGLFAIGGEPTPEAEFEITGDVRLDALQGGGTLRLAGDIDIVTANNQTGMNIINEGSIRLLGSPNNASADESSWRNAPGATLDFVGSADLNRSWPSQPATLINEADATIRKTGGGTTSIGWDLVNEGTIEIAEGSLFVTADLPNLTAPSSVIRGVGTLDFSQAPALLNRGVINPTPVNPSTDPDGFEIDIPYIQNADTAVFRTQIGSLAGKLTCSGIVDIGGTIDIQRFGDFEPDGTEEFVVLEAEFVSGVFGDYFTNAVPPMGSDTAFGVRTGDLEYDLTYTPTQLIVSNIDVIVPPCNPADIAEPAGLLDLADITAFIQAFEAGCI